MRQSQRSRRLSGLIQRSLANILIQHYRHNPRLLLVTVTLVETAADLSTAKVFFTILGGQENQVQIKTALEELKREGHNLRQLLARELNLRVTPRLGFFYDEIAIKAQKLSAMIDAAVAVDAEHHAGSEHSSVDE
jgi:ribosome-binding factor A